MTNEELRKELNEATKIQKEATSIVNEALCHAAGQMERVEREAYDRGLNDGWEMVWNVFEYVPAIRAEIFGVSPANFDQILTNFTPQQALAKIRAWEEKKVEEERKKQEEAEKIQIGDVVKITIGNCTGVPPTCRGVVISDTEYSMLFMRKNGQTDCIVKDSAVTIEKTGEHVDILGVLKE